MVVLCKLPSFGNSKTFKVYHHVRLRKNDQESIGNKQSPFYPNSDLIITVFGFDGQSKEHYKSLMDKCLELCH